MWLLEPIFTRLLTPHFLCLESSDHEPSKRLAAGHGNVEFFAKRFGICVDTFPELILYTKDHRPMLFHARTLASPSLAFHGRGLVVSSWTAMATKPQRRPRGRPRSSAELRNTIIAIRVTASELKAFQAAAEELRRSTGTAHSVSSVVRNGALEYAAQISKRGE